MCTSHSSVGLSRLSFHIFATNWSMLICVFVMISVFGRQDCTTVIFEPR
uniref:Uncharacterized protein n=1 Tax=Arundo donax TaxID=35708 RepID=A0A0A9F877_ARUDO